MRYDAHRSFSAQKGLRPGMFGKSVMGRFELAGQVREARGGLDGPTCRINNFSDEIMGCNWTLYTGVNCA